MCNPLYCPKVEAPTVMGTITLSFEVFTSHGNRLALWPSFNPLVELVSQILCVFIPSGWSLVRVRLLCCVDTDL